MDKQIVPLNSGIKPQTSFSISPLRIVKVLLIVIMFLPILVSAYITLGLVYSIFFPSVGQDSASYFTITPIVLSVDGIALFYLIKLFKTSKISLFEAELLFCLVSIAEFIFFVFTLPN